MFHFGWWNEIKESNIYWNIRYSARDGFYLGKSAAKSVRIFFPPNKMYNRLIGKMLYSLYCEYGWYGNICDFQMIFYPMNALCLVFFLLFGRLSTYYSGWKRYTMQTSYSGPITQIWRYQTKSLLNSFPFSLLKNGMLSGEYECALFYDTFRHIPRKLHYPSR